MIYTEEHILMDKFRNDFNDFKLKLDKLAIDNIDLLIQNYSNISKIALKKFKKFKNNKNKLKEKNFLLVVDFLQYSDYTVDEKDIICNYCIKKIKGLWKHPQAEKTKLINLEISLSYTKDNYLAVCITKNVLTSKDQWLIRLLKMLKDNNINTRECVSVIASQSNDNFSDDIKYYKNITNYIITNILKCDNVKDKILFVCSNETRIADILSLTKDIQNCVNQQNRRITIYHDEAHSKSEGIPAFRSFIEGIIIQPNVYKYVPISASLGLEDAELINSKGNPLWELDNLKNNSMIIPEIYKFSSENEMYSGICDNIMYTVEDLSQTSKWINYDSKDLEIPRKIFKTLYWTDFEKKYNKYNDSRLRDELIKFGYNMDYIINYNTEQLKNYLFDKFCDYDKKKHLGFVTFLNNEKEAMINGKNFLNINFILDKNIIIPNKFNIYIMSTPCRNVLTRQLSEEAILKSYKPLVLSIYGSYKNICGKYMLLGSDKIPRENVSEYMGKGELNEQILNLITKLKQLGENINRPFFIIGNYFQTGESTTFVHSGYGTVRINFKLVSTDPAQDYQESARSNYVDTHFKTKHGDNWKKPEKFLIGPKEFIENAKSYEKVNDDHINNQSNDINEMDRYNVNISDVTRTKVIIKNGQIHPPIKFTIVDPTYDSVKKLIYFFKKKRRNKHYEDIMNNLKEAVDNKRIRMNDPHGMFNFKDFGLRCVRMWTKEMSPNPSHWKFKSYETHHKNGTNFCNHINNGEEDIKECECELFGSIDFYESEENSKGEIIYHPPNEFYICYKT